MTDKIAQLLFYLTISTPLRCQFIMYVVILFIAAFTQFYVLFKINLKKKLKIKIITIIILQ